ncbi:MAG: carboxypeptidase regulatory-like domain-containing protein [Acidobacteria bacterium]|nr:carboxypeptidase regulatory-like domain-containing protein [Acidobacteriota bacterium]
MRSSIRLLLVVLCCVVLSLPLFAQKTTGSIVGAVTDQAGAVVSGADVTATNPSTGTSRSAKTSATGDYSITELPAGSYDITIKQANFKEYVSKGVQLFVSSTTTVNAMLTVGSASEQMTVEANAVQVETATGAVGNVVEGNQVRELPLNGRSFAQLTQLMPGVSPASNFDSKHKGLEAGVDFSVNGNNTTGNIFLVDGVNNNDIGSNRTILVYPSIDAIQEFKILRNSYGPEFGQAMGAVINIVTQGGTNQFHGKAFYFGRNDALNAADYFNNLNGIGKDKLRRNDFGYTFGGPIVKDKLFFFWSQEWNRELRGAARSAGVPTVAEKNGDFSNLRVVNGEACENTPTVNGSPATSIPLDPDTGLPQVSPTGQLLVNLFPDPNIANPSDCHHNWSVSLASPIYWREENIRADYKLGKTWSIMGRYTQDHWNQPSPSTLGYWGDDNYPSVDPNWIQPGYQATVKVTKLLGNTAVNDFQLSYAANRITVSVGGDNPGIVQQINQSYNTYFPIEGKFLGANMGYPVFWGGLGNGAGDQNLWNMGPWHNNEELYILKDDFSKVHGAHTFKVGFLASNNKKNELSGGSSGEAANYWGVDANNTQNGTFNALWDQTTWGFGESQTNPFVQTRWHDFEWYFGDTWKVRRNVTLEYGVRYSRLRNPYSAVDKISSWQRSLYNPDLGGIPCNGLLVVPGTDPCSQLPEGVNPAGSTPGQNRSLKDNNNHMFAPRIGIAWDPKGDGKMVFRGGIGQFYQRERLSNYLYIATNSPFSLAAGGSRHLSGSVAPGSLTASASPSWGLDPRNVMPNTWQWNFTFEKQLYRDSKLEVAYVGNRGNNVLSYADANAVLPDNRLHFALNNSNSDRFAGSFGSINYAQWTARSNYNALQALYRTRLKSVDAQFAYTWSKSLANTDITNSGNTSSTTTITDISNQNLDYGPTPINRPHVFVSNIVYNFPSFKGHNGVFRAIAGDWEAGGILQYASGPSQSIFGLGGGAGNGIHNFNSDTNLGDTGLGANSIASAPGGLQGTGYGTNQKPNRVLQDCRLHGGPAHDWYNPNAFTLDNYQIGGFGNSGVGSCSGPGIANTDFSLYKNFKLGERVNVQFRMEFYNLFNKTQFRADQNNFQLANGATACNADNNIVRFENVKDSEGVVHLNQPYTTACFGHDVNTAAYTFSGFADPQNANRDPGVPNTIPGNGQGNFGQITRDRGPREIQYALKIIF